MTGFAATPALGNMEMAACESLSIGVDGPEYLQTCMAGDFTISGSNGAPYQLHVEDVVAIGAGSELMIGSYKASHRAYLMTRSARWFVLNQGWFETVRSWGEGSEVEKFKAIWFEARRRGERAFRSCVGFVRFLYRVPQSFAGYRKAVGGAYCKELDTDIPTDEVGDVLQSLKF